MNVGVDALLVFGGIPFLWMVGDGIHKYLQYRGKARLEEARKGKI